MQNIKTFAEFQQVIQNGMTLVKFSASWCVPCQKIQPELTVWMQELPSVRFATVDIDQNEETCEELEITTLPTFHVYQDQKLLYKMSGTDLQSVKAFVEPLVKQCQSWDQDEEF